MTETVKVIELDQSKQGMALTALVEYRNRQLDEGQRAKLAEEVIRDIFNAKTRRKRVRARDEAR